MAIGEFYEVTLYQRYREQVLINRWHYEQLTGLSNAVGLRDGWQVAVLPAFSAIQSDDVSYTRLLVQNLNNPTDNAEDVTPTPAVGGVADTSVPLRLALAFRSNRPDLSRRYSWKRVGGIASGLLTGDVFNAAHANIANLAVVMGVQVAGGGSNWRPAQLKATCPGGGAPCTYTMNYPISGWIALPEPSTQDTRKLGRGI